MQDINVSWSDKEYICDNLKSPRSYETISYSQSASSSSSNLLVEKYPLFAAKIDDIQSKRLMEPPLIFALAPPINVKSELDPIS